MKEQIRVVVAEVGKPAEVREIENKLEAMQAIVGGYIETLCLNEDTLLVMNEEGRMRGLSPNLMTDVYGIIVGPVFVAKVSGEDFVSLSDLEAGTLMSLLNRARFGLPS